MLQCRNLDTITWEKLPDLLDWQIFSDDARLIALVTGPGVHELEHNKKYPKIDFPAARDIHTDIEP